MNKIINEEKTVNEKKTADWSLRPTYLLRLAIERKRLSPKRSKGDKMMIS